MSLYYCNARAHGADKVDLSWRLLSKRDLRSRILVSEPKRSSRWWKSCGARVWRAMPDIVLMELVMLGLDSPTAGSTRRRPDQLAVSSRTEALRGLIEARPAIWPG